MNRTLLAIGAAIAAAAAPQIQADSVIFDDFNVTEGHFTGVPNASGSSANVAASSTATRETTASPREGAGHERLVFNATTAGSLFRCRFLSGGGSPANNTAFVTSAAEDGWIGLYVKTTEPGWTVQIWLEGPSNNGSVPKSVVADGAWHLYEWNLDDDTGGTDGWGALPGIFNSLPPAMLDGSHTIDSVIFRHDTAPATSTLYLDFVAKSASGTVENLLADPCLATSGVLVVGPVATNSSEVVVSSVSASATAVTVYQDSGSGMTAIGTKTSGITAGNNSVTVSGLVKAAQVAATQTVGGQESCVPATGVIAGGGANPRIRTVLSIRETTDSGPVGAVATDVSSTSIHFLGSSATFGTAPAGGTVINPSAAWQTVTFQRGTNEIVGDSGNVAGTTADGPGYNGTDAVSLQVYAYRTLPNDIQIFSAAAATLAADVTSNDVFTVNWTWDAVPGAQGYRILRSVNSVGYNESVDVAGNSYSDANTGWTAETTVTPSTAQPGRSVRWNPSVASTNNLPGQWGILESLNFVIDDLSDTGPHDLYIDNLQNGTTTWQTFESVPAGTVDFGFRAPSFSFTTLGSILTSPDQSVVSNGAADTGTKALRVRFQWAGTNNTRWLRLTTSGVGNPLVNLNDPISFRLLLLPVNTAPVPPPAPTIAAAQINGQTVLNWTDAHRLQASTLVTGTYTNVPNVTTAPWTNTFTEPQKFFRLVD